jgi:hypothetical protein
MCAKSAQGCFVSDLVTLFVTYATKANGCVSDQLLRMCSSFLALPLPGSLRIPWHNTDLMKNSGNHRSMMNRILNAALLLLLVVQVYILGSFSLNGYFRLYAPLCQYVVNHYIPDAFEVSFAECKIYPNAHLEIVQLDLQSLHPAIESVHIHSVQVAPIFAVEPRLGLRLNQISISRPQSELLHSQVRKIFRIDQIRCDLNKKGAQLNAQSVAVIFDAYRLHGNIKINNLHTFMPTQGKAISWPERHSKIDDWLTKIHNVSHKFDTRKTFINFAIEQCRVGQLTIQSCLQFESIQFADIQLRELAASLRYQYQPQNSVHTCGLFFKINEAHYMRTANDIGGRAITGHWEGTHHQFGSLLLNPKIYLQAPALIIDQVAQFRVPKLDIHFTDPGPVKINGYSFLEQLDQKMPNKFSRVQDILFHNPPILDFSLDYSPHNAVPHNMQAKLEVRDFDLQGLALDHLEGTFSWQQYNREIELHNASLRRGQDWIKFEGKTHLSNKNYRLSVEAAAIPTDYNPIMPTWWNKVFRDIEFLEKPRCYGNFEIVGRYGQQVADFFYGSVDAENLAYRGVPIDRGHLHMRGRQHYTEISELAVEHGDHYAHGSIQIAGLPDPIKVPLFWSIDLDSSYPLIAYQRLVSPQIAKHIQAFKAPQAPAISLQGKFFNKHYPQYRPYMHFQMNAASKAPIQYQDVHFDDLQFKLAGNSEQLSIYDLQAEIANGQASGQVDFLWNDNSAPSILIKAGIQQADTKKLLNMFQHEERASFANLTPIEESPSKINLEAHLKGLTGNWFEFAGYGSAAIFDKELGRIKLLGPLSSLLQNTPINFTSLKFKTLDCDFVLDSSALNFEKITIGGHSSQIELKGSYDLQLDTIDMHVTLRPLINYADKINPVTQLNKWIQLPLSPFLKYKLDGTLQYPQWRSILDPRVLLPIF